MRYFRRAGGKRVHHSSVDHSPPLRKLVQIVQRTGTGRQDSAQKPLSFSWFVPRHCACEVFVYITQNTSKRELYNGNRHISVDSLIGDLQEVWMYLSITAYHDRAYVDHMRFSCLFFSVALSHTNPSLHDARWHSFYVLSWLILQIATRQSLTVSSPQMQPLKGPLVLHTLSAKLSMEPRQGS